MRPQRLLPLILCMCGDSGGTSMSSATNVTTVDPANTGETTQTPPTSGASTSGESADAGTSEIIKLDTPDGVSEAGDTAVADDCPSVDILFVIDNSGSMADNQDSLIASFPGFVTGVQQQLAGAKSYHIGVVTSDYYSDNGACWDLGSLITKTGGPESSKATCGPFTSGGNYLDDTEPGLGGKFACIGKVGAGGGNDEKPIRSLLNALKPEMNAPGECNAGFARPDSLLVIVIITDEDDVADGCTPNEGCMTYGSGGEPEDWYAELLSYRGGIDDNIVVLSLLGRKLDNPCAAVPASHLMKFTNMFDEHGHLGDVCAGDYAPFFAEALPIIDEACVNWVPPQ